MPKVETRTDAAFKMSLTELEGVDELSTRVFRAFLNALRLHRQLMIAVLGEIDTHPGQAFCLRFLSANDGVTQRDLADSLHLAKPTVSKMLQAMEKAGAIERRPDEYDQRLTRVHLTPPGTDSRPSCGPCRRLRSTRPSAHCPRTTAASSAGCSRP